MTFIQLAKEKSWYYSKYLFPSQQKSVEYVKEKILIGDYTLENVSCFICHENKPKNVLSSDFYGIPSTLSICHLCGAVYTSKRLDEKSMMKIYENEYRSIDRPNESIEEFFKLQMIKGKRIREFVEASTHFTNKDLVIEIGCGAGGILKNFLDSGYSILGCDFNRSYMSYDKSVSPYLVYGGGEELKKKIDNRKVSLIIYEQVLEHIYDLSKELEMIKSIASRETLIYIGVPGFTNIHKHYLGNFHKFFQSFHLYHFTPQSLETVLRRQGFEILRMNDEIRCIAKVGDLLSKKETENANSYPQIMIYYYKLRIQYILMRIFYKFYFRIAR